MADLQTPFDPSSVGERQDFVPIPPGEYRMMITETEYKQNKKGTGTLIEYKAVVLDGPHAKRSMKGWINFTNSNPTSQKIGQEELGELCRALGLGTITNDVQLQNIPFLATVTVKAGEGERGPSNTIKKYKPLNAQRTTAPATAAPSAPGGGQPPFATSSSGWTERR